MKTVGQALSNTFPDLGARFEQAIALSAVRRDEVIARYGWPEDCVCDLCGDTGIDPELERFCSCEPGRAKRLDHDLSAKWLEVCPARFVDCRIDTHPDREASALVQRWVDRGFDARRNLILTGPVGTGKSGLALGAMRAIHMRGITCKFGTFSQILDQLRPRNDDDKAAKRENLDSLTRLGLLVIDDLGTHKESEWTAEQLFDLINGRTSTARPFIITTNWTTKEMAAALDDRLMSRLVEATDVVPVVGPDLRRKQRGVAA